MRTRTILNLLIAIALVFTVAAPAAAQGVATSDRPLVAFGLSFLNVEDTTGTGFGVDFAKQIRTMDKAAISLVGDVSFHHYEFGNAFGFLGGARITATTAAKYHPFGQFMVGATKFSSSDCEGDGCSETPFTIAFGGGVDVHINDKWNLRGQLDIPIYMFEGDSSTGIRFTVGVSTRIGG